MKMSDYRGRFAPSPTGPLHLGSLLAALASYLDAKSQQGEWLIRIEDIDPLREQPGASEQILDALYRHGLMSDAPVIFQSQRHSLYQRYLQKLQISQHTYACPCSRKQIAEQGHLPSGCPAPKGTVLPTAIRFKAINSLPVWFDQIQDNTTLMNLQPTENFILFRKEGFFAYQLAVVCDDIEQGITHVVRGKDLLESTPGQILLYQALQKPLPQYVHLPLILSNTGQKLSKQNHATPLNWHQPENNLRLILKLLNQKIPTSIKTGSVTDIIEWATLHWQINKVPSELPQSFR